MVRYVAARFCSFFIFFGAIFSLWCDMWLLVFAVFSYFLEPSSPYGAICGCSFLQFFHIFWSHLLLMVRYVAARFCSFFIFFGAIFSVWCDLWLLVFAVFSYFLEPSSRYGAICGCSFL